MKQLAKLHDRSLNGEIIQACRAWILVERERAAMGYQKRITASFNSELEGATDEMSERLIKIAPASLVKFLRDEADLPLTEQEAEKWLSRQKWYRKQQ